MADLAFKDNPWSPEFWNLTRQGEYVRKYGEDMARKKARDAGAIFGATRPGRSIGPYSPLPTGRNFTVIVQHKGANVGVGGGGLVGAGSSGDGAPS